MKIKSLVKLLVKPCKLLCVVVFVATIVCIYAGIEIPLGFIAVLAGPDVIGFGTLIVFIVDATDNVVHYVIKNKN